MHKWDTNLFIGYLLLLRTAHIQFLFSIAFCSKIMPKRIKEAQTTPEMSKCKRTAEKPIGLIPVFIAAQVWLEMTISDYISHIALLIITPLLPYMPFSRWPLSVQSLQWPTDSSTSRLALAIQISESRQFWDDLTKYDIILK